MTASRTSVMRWGFWGEHGHAAMEIGRGTLSVVDAGRTYSGPFTTAHAVSGQRRGTGDKPRRHGKRDLVGHRRGGAHSRL